MATVPAAPDVLTPVRPVTGVKRLNRVPLFIALGVGAVLMFIIFYTVHQRSLPPQPRRSSASQSSSSSAPAADAGDVPPVLQNAKATGEVPLAQLPPPPPEQILPQSPVPQAQLPGVSPPPGQPGPLPTPLISPQAAQAAAERAQRDAQARRADTVIGVNRQDNNRQGQAQAQTPADPTLASLAALENRIAGLAGQAGLPPGGGAAGGSGGLGSGLPGLGGPGGEAGLGGGLAGLGGPGGGVGPGGASGAAALSAGQAEKAAFLAAPGRTQDYLPSTRIRAISPYEVKAGTVIAAVLDGGIDSDNPGMIIAHVSQNIYDTVTGNFLLIPQGTKLLGAYDSAVTMGQERVLVAWQRMIYPDGSSVDLGRMVGADEGGYSGLHDLVDNHFWRTFGQVVLLSLFSTGAQLSQPQAANGSNYNSAQIVAGAVGANVTSVAQGIIERQLNLAPTLKIRPGFKSLVVVDKDIILPPYSPPLP